MIFRTIHKPVQSTAVRTEAAANPRDIHTSGIQKPLPFAVEQSPATVHSYVFVNVVVAVVVVVVAFHHVANQFVQ